MVGAHIEEVAPRRVVLPADAGSLLLLLALSVVLHAWLLTHTFVTARDSLRFARTALLIESPNVGRPDGTRSFVDVLRDPQQCPDPPLFPMQVLLVSKIVGLTSALPTPERMLLAAQIASSLAAVLLVLPSYWLGRMLFARRFAGVATALLFQVLPTVAHITSDGLADACSLLAIVTSLVCACRALRTRSTMWFLLTGLASGFGYLVRPEAMIVAVALGIVTVAMGVRSIWPRGIAIGRLTALSVGLLLMAGPYMVLIGGVSNKPSVNEPLRKLMPLRFMTAEAAPTMLLAEWYSGSGSQTLWAFTAIAKETIKAAHYAPFVLGLIGLYWFRRKLDPAFAVVLVAGLLQIGLLLLLAMKPTSAGAAGVPPYVSERHTLLLAFIICLFTGGLLAQASARVGAVVLIALVASALPSALKPLHENRAGHYFAGRYLADQIRPDEAVIDPFEWAHYYAGHSLYGMPPDPADTVLVARWIVWEPTAGTKQNPHSRLPRLEAARAVLNDRANPSVLMFHWPADVDPAEAKVVVYRQSVRK